MRMKILALTLVFVLLCSVMLPGSAALPVLAQVSDAPVPLSEEKVYCNATLEDDFADDRVVVLLSNKASTSLHTYTKADFAGIGCTEVQNLTQYTTAQVNAKLRGETAELQKTAEPNVITFAEFSKVDTENFHQILCLTLETPGKQNVLDAIAALMKHPDVIAAEPDYTVYAATVTPNDTYRTAQWAIDKIQLRQAWDYTTGSSTVRVGVIDSGIDGDHPDLDGHINVSLSREFYSGSAASVSSVTDDTGHGTFVAGIIGAETNNNQGISGTCFNVQLVSLKVADYFDAQPSISGIYHAVDYAQSQAIPILNISITWGESQDNQADTVIARSKFQEYDGLIVCAAGNYGLNIDDTTVYPGSYSLPNLIVVGASTQNDSRAEFSDFGNANVDLFAPGVSILSCYPYDECVHLCNPNDGKHYNANSPGYHYNQGTSFAAPYVTGVAALVLAKYPNLNAAQIKERIMGSVDVVAALRGLCVRSGRLNAYKAVHPHSLGH